MTTKSKIYTGVGDSGETSLVGGQRVSKSEPQINAYGTVDELNSFIGLAVSLSDNLGDFEVKFIQKIQNNLFNLG
ncbi:MAG: ATP:cob(I)alamin adenosyltransferase, partial [Bacteriovoracaceae bacterium]|nr:ATP:cob(I)alamin adenosyltransferase [Bacteriovoracaceae bacterium]